MMIYKLNIINLPERIDRKTDLLKMLAENGISNFKIWNGIKEKRWPRLGILKAHKQIVRNAKECGLPFVHIAEDDIQFFGKGAWEYYLSKLPHLEGKSVDIFFSMVYAGKINSDCKLESTCSGMTLYTVYSQFYDFFLNAPEENGGVHVDRYLTSFWATHDFWVCDKFVCQQSGSFSDNSKKKVDYTPLLRYRTLFKPDGGPNII